MREGYALLPDVLEENAGSRGAYEGEKLPRGRLSARNRALQRGGGVL